MKRPNINTLIILGFIVMAIVIVGIIALIFKIQGSSSSSTGEPNMNSYTDPASGETILSPEGKLPEKYGTNPDAPVIIGFDELLTRGLSLDQTSLIKGMLNDYADQVKSKGKITEISLVKGSISHTHDRNTGGDTYDFSLLFNRKDTYAAHITIPDTDTVALSLTKASDSTPVYQGTKSNVN